ncbi:hypothetical protein MTR67_048214 [Solanum verrucosum]|uniref:Uncharacterized protein n=1 Tax=Solanum verrucosum TaxID=315347 RepID=A0AAF0ZZT7_SOLVR|nr:hypothetical protein MTR67_048214 [Solanum verrucosum]
MSTTFHPQTNGYHSNIQMAPFEVLYGRRRRSYIDWFNSTAMDSFDIILLRNTMEYVCRI